MPNGNILALVYDANTYEEAEAFGWARTEFPKGKVSTESIIEIEPNLETGGSRIVWRWDSRNHLGKNDYGKLDPNYDRIKRRFVTGQIFHFNSIDYNEALDQILVSSAVFGEVLVIDHDTTAEEAKGEKGDFLYRWGNPHTHGAGDDEDTQLWWQHDAEWLDSNGKIMIFNNGGMRDKEGRYDPEQVFLGLFDGAWSDVPIVQLPLTDDGNYDKEEGATVERHFNRDGDVDFIAPFMSGAQLLPNDNLLLVQAHDSRVLEVLPDGTPVLDFQLALPGRLFRVTKFGREHPAVARMVE